MKKYFTLAILSALTLAGGSWLAAQQDEPARKSRYDDGALPTISRDGRDDSAVARPAEVARDTGSKNGSHPVYDNARASSRQATGLNVQNLPTYQPGFNNNYGGGYGNYGGGYGAGPMPPMHTAAGTFPTPPQIAGIHVTVRMSPEEAARMRAFQDAIGELRSAENDEEKSTARALVAKLVGEQLDADLESREKELAAIEQRSKELRKQLDERKTAKPELLKMLVMLIDNPQVGLGIPPEWMQMLMRGQPSSNQSYQYGFAPGYIVPNTYPSPPQPARLSDSPINSQPQSTEIPR